MEDMRSTEESVTSMNVSDTEDGGNKVDDPILRYLDRINCTLETGHEI